jgi:hypothetical protein
MAQTFQTLDIKTRARQNIFLLRIEPPCSSLLRAMQQMGDQPLRPEEIQAQFVTP